ncbi:DUF455-domain-containing protein [Punctularia strigosozonata HHB-11173 SS5]|uniref:DUF455-domain-containing protein n=1 Tax=Punctularia strigosozonata (strain HHB-11173) TaxID=741275 RepID=UPI0004416EE2|nr:DUF455-domain-containing protein [Punctularia strigosozonata HHB-11173 SS5]EIN06535.1 DUF455-domain-containing protein [Punctularia strigosozonata HHB-11173 SS5]
MESSCPHLGADMSHAEIEECETSMVAVCPWHRYDFDLQTGKSETGLKACTYAVEVRPRTAEDDKQYVWLQPPDDGSNWRVVELRPVSEDFADPPPATASSQLPPTEKPDTSSDETEPIVPEANAPKTLIDWAVLILNTPDPTLKVARTRHAVHLFHTGQLSSIGHRSSTASRPPETPPRHKEYANNTVDPAAVKTLGNRRKAAVMLHALANIEQWAFRPPSWDIIARFGPTHNPPLPPAFFADFAKVALDESKHFSLLAARLEKMGARAPSSLCVRYGSLPVHAGLWESALVTKDSLRSRLAIIHLVHEARGLDVNPGTIERFRRAGDAESVKVLEIIHHDEVTHVTAGHRWFTHCCAQDGVDPIPTFREEVRRGWRGELKGPFNADDRERAGLIPAFYEGLRGGMLDSNQAASSSTSIGY